MESITCALCRSKVMDLGQVNISRNLMFELRLIIISFLHVVISFFLIAIVCQQNTSKKGEYQNSQ